MMNGLKQAAQAMYLLNLVEFELQQQSQQTTTTSVATTTSVVNN
jgi:hypothetical protein